MTVFKNITILRNKLFMIQNWTEYREFTKIYCFQLPTVIRNNLLLISRELAESSPYFEALKSQDVEVLFTYDENDEVVFAALQEFQKKKIISAENFLMKEPAESSEPKIVSDSTGNFLENF